MARNMSFSKTTDQMRARTKTVTRRIGWADLRVGNVLNACVKCQGLRKGERVEVICQIRVVSVRREAIWEIARWDDRETAREGFPGMSPSEFLGMFCREMKCHENDHVQRIEFEYIEGDDDD